MNGKKYTENGINVPITYGNASGNFGGKVTAAIAKVDDTVTGTELVQNATDLKNALKSGGEIKEVVNYWDDTIQNIDTEANPTKTRDDESNKSAREAIAVIRRYTEDTDNARSSIGQHDTADNAAPSE